MERFKLKNVIYLFFAFIFLFILTNSQITEAASNEYVVSVEIEGLEYGDTYSSGNIVVKKQSIPGEFSFLYPDLKVNKTGFFDICVVFTPQDLETYEETRLMVTVEVKAIDVVIVFDSPIYKQYDGKDSAVLPTHSYQGIIHDDVTVEGELIGKYANTYVSENIDIILSGVTLQGEHAGAYRIILDGHTGRIHPSYIQDLGNEVVIDIEDDIFIDVKYNLRVKNEVINNKVNDKYTSFNKYKFVLLDHNNELLNVKGNYTVALKISEDKMSKERLTVFELDENGEYHELEYTYTNGTMYFEIDADSEVVFTTRDIENNLIVVFTGVLLFSLIFMLVSLIKNSRISEREVFKEEK